MKKILTVLTMLVTGLLCFSSNAYAEGENLENGLVFHVENQDIPGKHFTNLNDHVKQLEGLDEGTIVVRFLYKGDGVMSLFSLSNNLLANDHFHVYITPSGIGSENRYEAPGKQSKNIHMKANVNVKENQVHTLAMTADKNEGYKLFLDGDNVLHDTTTERQFLSQIFEPNSAQLGRTERAGNSNNYHFNGVIDFAEVYSKPLSDQVLTDMTGVTSADPVLNPQPDDALITAPDSVFYPGLYGSKAYRIPALLNTKDNTLIAGIDKRINHAGDSPANIDMMVRRSMDQGDTWERNGMMVNEYPGDASNIDQSLLQDSETNRIYSLVDGFAEGGGFPTAKKGTGYKTVDDKAYMLLYDKDEQEYTIREDGVVYDKSDKKTGYSVDEKRNLYEHGKKISNIFLDKSPLKPLNTSYLELWHSDDDGQTWEGTENLNAAIKEDWMAFLGTGPGTGIQMKNGPHKGRLVYPIYFTNENSAQASAVIYSDDHGKTWERGESPNEGRKVDGTILDERTFTGSNHELTESQVVEMPDGQLKLFMRNYSGYAQIATSFDGGQTWDADVVTEHDLVAPYSQVTAIRYNGQIDNHEAVIFAIAGNASSRINGTVKAGLIKEDGTYPNGRVKYKFDWKYSQLVKEGAYGYSSLTNLDHGNIGLLYENDANMDFIKFNPAFLKWQKEGKLPEPALKSLQIVPEKDGGYLPADTIRVKAEFDDYVMLSGARVMTGKIGNQEVALHLAEANQSGTEFVFEGKIPEMQPGVYALHAAFSDGLDVRNVYGKEMDLSDNANQLATEISVLQEMTSGMIKERVEELHAADAFADDRDARLLQVHLTAIERYEKKALQEKVVKHMEGFKVLLKQMYQREAMSDEVFEGLLRDAENLLKRYK